MISISSSWGQETKCWTYAWHILKGSLCDQIYTVFCTWMLGDTMINLIVLAIWSEYDPLLFVLSCMKDQNQILTQWTLPLAYQASALQFLQSITWLQPASSKYLWHALPRPFRDTAGYCPLLRYLLLQSVLSATVPGLLCMMAWCGATPSDGCLAPQCPSSPVPLCAALPACLVGGQKPVQHRATDSWAHWFPSKGFIWKAHGTYVLLEAFSWQSALYSLSTSAAEETSC